MPTKKQTVLILGGNLRLSPQETLDLHLRLLTLLSRQLPVARAKLSLRSLP